MTYRASGTVALADGTTQDLEASGDTRNEALENLSDQVASINVEGFLLSTLRTYRKEEGR
jgi:hypothetical protein